MYEWGFKAYYASHEWGFGVKSLEYGIEKGRVEGRAEGAITAIVGLIKDGILTIENGAKRLNISESELIAYLS